MKLQELILTIVAAVWLAGCGTPEGAYVAVAKPNSPEAAGAQVVLLSHDLIRTLAVDKPVQVDRDAVGRLRVQVGLRNRVDKENLQIQVQTLWMNDAGRVLYSQPGSETAWQSMSVSPNLTVYYSQTALTTEATKYSIRVRYTGRTK
jgi:hypothetical protein